MTVSFTAKTLSPVPKTLPGTCSARCGANGQMVAACVTVTVTGLILQGRQGWGPPGATVALLASVMNWVLSHLQQHSLAPAYPSRPRLNT